jgi:WD40 repeat protein
LCRRKGLVQSWEAHDSYRYISSFAYSPNGNLLVSSGYDRTVKFWDAANDYTCVQTLQADNKEVHSVAFSPNGEIIAIGGDRGHCLLLSLWRVSDGSKIREVEFEVEREMSTLSTFLRELKFSPDGQAVAICGYMEDNEGTNNGFLGLWKLDGTEDGCINLEGHTEGVNDLAFSLDGECLVLSSRDKNQAMEFSNKSVRQNVHCSYGRGHVDLIFARWQVSCFRRCNSSIYQLQKRWHNSSMELGDW